MEEAEGGGKNNKILVAGGCGKVIGKE